MSNPISARRSVAPRAEETISIAGADSTATAPWLAVVAEKVKTMRFGVVQIVIHDSKVVQIERTERTRFEVPNTAGGQ